MQRGSFAVLAAGLWAVACTSEVLVLDDGNESTPPSTSGTGGSGASSGTGGTGLGGTGGTGGAPGCGRTYDRFDMELVTFEQLVWGCYSPSGTAVGYQQLEGVVVESTTNFLVIDSCPPSADCVPLLSTLSFSALDLWSYVPIGAFVRLSVQVEQPWGCTHQLMVLNLPFWDGMPNPVLPGEMLYLAAADGVPMALPGAPFEVTQVPLGCYPNEPPNCAYPEDYVLQFHSPFAEPLAVYMGELGDWYLGGNEFQYLNVRNLRSYESGWCDDYWNYAYWVSGGMLIEG